MVTTKVLDVGEKAPEFNLLDQESKEVSMKDYKGKWVVLYFYPKDDTPGCTIEANEFTSYQDKFSKLNTEILGVSPDSSQSHEKFCRKYDLSIRLISDPEHTLAEKYGAWQLKKNYGKEYMGIQRSTFIINPEGVVAYKWASVTAKGHAEKVLEKIQALQK